MVGCGGDNPLSGGDEGTQSQDLTDKAIVYLDSSGNLRTANVYTDHGDMLTVSSRDGKVELQRSEVLGVGSGPPTREGITFAKGNYLDSYGDEFADIEYLHGMLGAGYRSLTDGEYVVVRASVSHGITFSGEEVQVMRKCRLKITVIESNC